jgi:hypothetical protein
MEIVKQSGEGLIFEKEGISAKARQRLGLVRQSKWNSGLDMRLLKWSLVTSSSTM